MLMLKAVAEGPLFQKLSQTAAQKCILMGFNSSKGKLSLLENTAERFLLLS